MKIVQIGNFPLDYNVIIGGVETSIFGITKALAKNNEVKVISSPNKLLEKDQILFYENIEIHHLANPCRFNILSFFRMKEITSIIQAFDAEIVHIHDSSILTLLLVWFLRQKKRNTIVTVHGIHYIEMWKIFKRAKTVVNFLRFVCYSCIEYLVILSTKKIIVDTQYVANMLSKIKKKEYFVIPQGIDESYFELEDQYKPDQILSVGSVSRRKGHEYSILSMAELTKEFPNIRLHIIGVILPQDSEYYSYLLRLIKEKELENHVVINANLPIENLKQEFRECYLFVLHSYEESQGIAICEAMAAGKPIVATRIGGIPYIVEENVNSRLVLFEDVKEFSKNIKEILSDINLRNRMGKESKRLSYNYSWDMIALKILDVYNNKIA